MINYLFSSLLTIVVFCLRKTYLAIELFTVGNELWVIRTNKIKITKTENLKTDLKNSKTNNSNKNDESAAEILEEGITITTKSENIAELERKINELEQINSSLKDDNNNKIDETLNMKTNELAKTLQDLKPHKEKSESEKKDFQNKLKILEEENTISETKTINYMKHLK